jgi:acyl dehydratase
VNGGLERPRAERYFEDYPVGAGAEYGYRVVEADEIVTFARQYDPQYFHVDPATAPDGPFGGLIASGWHTAAIMMRLYADHFLSTVASLGGPGVDALRWLVPVRPGDQLRLRVEVLEARRSASKPDRGLIRTRTELINQDDVVAFRAEVLNFLRCRERTG